MEEQDKSYFESINLWKADRIVSISAIFISLLTLITFVYQNNLLQKQAALSVMPYLAVGASYNNDKAAPSFQLRLINRGVGPAIIESQKIFYKGKTYNTDLYEFLSEHLPGLDTLSGISRTSFDFGHVLPSGEEIDLIGVYDDIDNVNLIAGKIDELSSGDTGLKYEVIYQSIYGERWKITESSSLPLKLRKSQMLGAAEN